MLNDAKRNMRTRQHHRATGSFSDRSTPGSSQTNAFANAKGSYERYVVLARAAALTGDTIQTENLYQHAEHYFRLMRGQAV